MKLKLRALETIQTIMLFTVSAYFTCSRFAELSIGSEAIAFIALGAGFELVRVTLWIRGHLEHNKNFKRFAIFLTALSLTASVSKITAGLEVIEEHAGSADSRLTMLEERVRLYKENEAVLQKRLAEVPANYVTASMKVQAELEKAMEKRIEAENALMEAKEVENGKEQKRLRDMFDTIGAVFGISEAGVKLLRMIFLLLIALGSEIGLLESSRAAVERKVEVKETGEGEGKKEEVKTEVKEKTLTERFAEFIYRDGKAGAHVVPSWRRGKDESGIGRSDWEALVDRAIKRGIVYTRNNKMYTGKEFTEEEFEEALR